MSGSGKPRSCSWTLCLLAVLAGCGTTKSRLATEQLLMSDAVDRSIAQIDFSPLSGKAVYFDTKYLAEVKGLGFVNAPYLISSLRQQLLAAGCLLQEKEETSELIVEARCGTLGADGHEVTYGMPASSGLTTVASMLPNAPPVPAIPEIAIAKRQDNRAAAKIGVFAYHRETRLPVWQSGISVSTSNAKDVWLFGAGPFQNGTIYDGTQFAGSRVRLPLIEGEEDEQSRPAAISYFHEMDFERARRVAARRRQQALQDAERMAEIPELMPLTERTFGAGSVSVARRLPPVEGEDADSGTDANAAAAPPGSTPPEPAATPAAAEAPAAQAPSAEAPAAAAPAAEAPAAEAPAAEEPASGTVVR